jgi:Domain of unknown function (DUF4432)
MSFRTIIQVLTDASRNIALKEWTLSSDDLSAKPAWSITKRMLVGGRQDRCEIIEVDNGAIRFTIVPTRGLSLWSLQAGDVRLGWDSPVKEIVHPQFVNLAERGGLGWLDGFGEWISRCGLESMGAPCKDGEQTLTLHGRINYIPASYVEVRYEPLPVPRIVVRGIVDETMMFGPQLRLTAEISTELGTRALTLDDTVTNLSDTVQEMESLYHINFGPPLLGAGAVFVAPIKAVAPRDARAAEGAMAGWNRYAGPHGPGYTEQVYLMELHADSAGITEAMLKSPDGTKAALVSFNVRQLPFMTLWKNEASLGSGYVTGLEPGTSFPYPKPIERAAGRIPILSGGQSHRSMVTFKFLDSHEEVKTAAASIEKMQASAPRVSRTPLHTN